MDVIKFIKRDMAGVRRTIESTMKDMTAELFNYAPPGTANTISATFVHLMNTEDDFIQMIIQGKPSVWETQNWSDKTGISKPPSIGEDWSEFRHKQVAIQPLMDYKDAVWAATDVYLASLSHEELEREVGFAGGTRTVADMLSLCAAQSRIHIGEIAALKGIQGVKGFPI